MEKQKAAPNRIWAAYVFGYDVWDLWHWQHMVWASQLHVMEGYVKLGPELPDSAASLRDAVEALHPAGRDRFRIGQFLAKWEEETSHMLREFTVERYYDSDINWDDDAPHGFLNLMYLREEIEDMLSATPHLKKWFLLGQTMQTCRTNSEVITPDSCRDVREQLAALHREGRYAFIPPLLKFLNDPGSTAPTSDEMHSLWDPDWKRPRTRCLDTYIRARLKVAVPPEPVIVLRPNELVLFGQKLPREMFHRAEWMILGCLCKHPLQLVARETIVKECGLACGPRGIPPHVTRLRSRLRPIIEKQYRGAVLDSNARACFIIGFKKADGQPYQLDLDKSLVRIEKVAIQSRGASSGTA